MGGRFHADTQIRRSCLLRLFCIWITIIGMIYTNTLLSYNQPWSKGMKLENHFRMHYQNKISKSLVLPSWYKAIQESICSFIWWLVNKCYCIVTDLIKKLLQGEWYAVSHHLSNHELKIYKSYLIWPSGMNPKKLQ